MSKVGQYSSAAAMIKKLRLKHHITQKKLAEILGVSSGTVASWEMGNRFPRWKTLSKLSNEFGLHFDGVPDCDVPQDKETEKSEGLEKPAAPNKEISRNRRIVITIDIEYLGAVGEMKNE